MERSVSEPSDSGSAWRSSSESTTSMMLTSMAPASVASSSMSLVGDMMVKMEQICEIIEQGPKWLLHSFLAAMEDLHTLHAQLGRKGAVFCEALERASLMNDILKLQSLSLSKLLVEYHNELQICSTLPTRHILLAISKSDLDLLDHRPALLRLPPLSPHHRSSSCPSTSHPNPFPSAYSRVLNKPCTSSKAHEGSSRMQAVEVEPVTSDPDEEWALPESCSLSSATTASTFDAYSGSREIKGSSLSCSASSPRSSAVFCSARDTSVSEFVTEDMKDEALSAWLFPSSARILRKISLFLDGMEEKEQFSIGRARVVKALFSNILKEWQEGAVNTLLPKELSKKLIEDLHLIMIVTLGEKILCEKITKDVEMHFPILVSHSGMSSTLSFILAMPEVVAERVELLPCPDRIYALLDLFRIMDIIDAKVVKLLLGTEEEEENKEEPCINSFGVTSISVFLCKLSEGIQNAFLAYTDKIENPSTSPPTLDSSNFRTLASGGIHPRTIEVVNAICTFYDKKNYYGEALFKLLGEAAYAKKMQAWAKALLEALSALLNREISLLGEREQHLFMMNNVHFVCKTLDNHEATMDQKFSEWTYYRSEGFFLNQFVEKCIKMFPQPPAPSTHAAPRKLMWRTTRTSSPLDEFHVALQDLVLNSNLQIPDNELRRSAQKLITTKISYIHFCLDSNSRYDHGAEGPVRYTPDSIERIMKHVFSA